MLENDTEGVQRHWINALLAWHTDECMHAGTESETRQADLLTGKDHDNIVRKPGRNICALLFFLSGQQSFLYGQENQVGADVRSGLPNK